eukprot:9219529-Alexandrium_andersonii.AAC.1
MFSNAVAAHANHFACARGQPSPRVEIMHRPERGYCTRVVYWAAVCPRRPAFGAPALRLRFTCAGLGADASPPEPR